jgi:hypothetical protein
VASPDNLKSPEPDGLPHRKHWFHGLGVTFGEYGDQTVHWHPCCGEREVVDAALDSGTDTDQTDCDWALIGVGRKCGGKGTRHWTQSLQARVESSAALDG